MIGQVVSHYRILEKLGEGGMGEVFLAEDTKLERKVALKFLPLKTSMDKDIRKRFEREAKAAAALNHPNIVTIHEIDEAENRVYIAMEYVRGETLRETIRVLENHLSDSGREVTALLEMMPIHRLIDIAIQVCHGLEEAHAAGIIHRDIKLQNIILDKNNRVKILDFGLAKLKGASKITGEVSRVGTIYYMSPEQAQGEEVDLRTDIWSLGVVLYQMVTGKPPFQGEHEQAVIHSIINDSPQPPGEVRDGLPEGFEKIIMKCLFKNREDRYPSARELLSDLKKQESLLKGDRPEAAAAEEEKPETARETERRQVTVVIAEITGYRKLLKESDAEEAASVMNDCFEIFGGIVEKYGGSIDRIMGNDLTALFGIPTALEDAPKKAVNAAIEMRNRLYAFNREKDLPTPLDIRVGINTGMVIAGAVGPDDKSDYSIVGDTVTFASKLKDFSKKGRIYAGPLTYRQTKDEFDYKELKLIILKGKTKPATVFRLLSFKEKIHRPGFEPGRMIDSEMVGREKELDKLKLHLLKVINGEGSIVSIIGEAGMGKSRLIAELKKMEEIAKVTLLEGRALSIGKNLSYHPVIDILKGWTGINEEEDESESLSRLERTVTNICPENAAEIFPFVATLMGMSLSGKHAERIKGIEGGAMEKLILKNMRELIIKGAEKRPMVLILEDLQWADTSSVELLESLFRAAENNPILFINVIRPGDKETGDRIVETADLRHPGTHTKIHLGPLGEKECEALIRNLAKVDDIPSGTGAAITNRAEGNPSFIEEVVRSLIDEGVVEVKDGKFYLTEKIESVVIPKTIQGVLMARIDRLDESTKTLLKEASVIGRYFFHKVLAGVTETTGDIDRRLLNLKDARLILERTRLGEVEYFFRHALAQEAVYESILLKKRKDIHLAVARAIETAFSGRLFDFYGMLALHYSRGENLEKAEAYLLKAGAEAMKAAASSEALSYYRDALGLYLKKYADDADPEKVALLEYNIARAYYNKGNMADAVIHFDNVLELWGEKRVKGTFRRFFYFILDVLRVFKTLYFPPRRRTLKPTPRDNTVFETAYLRGTALAFTDPYRMGRDSIRLLRNLRKYDPAEVRGGVTMWALAGGIFYFSGLSFHIAKKILDQTRRYINPGNQKDVFTFDLYESAYHILSGNWERELPRDMSAVDRGLNEGDLFTAPLHLLLYGVLASEKGLFDRAGEYIDKLREIGEDYENDSVRVIRYVLCTRLLLQRRKLFEALREADEGIVLSGRSGQDIFLLGFHGFKANIQVLQGDMEKAEESLTRAEQLLSRERTVTPGHISSYRLSRFLFDVCRLEKSLRGDDTLKIEQFSGDARRSGNDAVKTASKCAIFRTETFRLTGTYYWLINRQKTALHWWEKSIRTGKRLGARPELARTYMEIGKRLMEKGSDFDRWDRVSGPGYLDKARRLFEEMEMEWDIQLLERENV